MANFNGFYNKHRNALNGRFHGAVQFGKGLSNPIRSGWFHFLYYGIKAIAGDDAGHWVYDKIWGTND